MSIRTTVELIRAYLVRNKPSTGSTRQTISAWRARLLWGGLVVAFLCAATGILGYTFTVSEGQRTGTLRKLSYKGLVFKTGEAELVLQGIRGEASKSRGSLAIPGALTDVWEFSTAWGDEPSYRKLEAAMDAGQPVVIKYKERYFAKWQLTQTPYLVVDVKPVAANEAQPLTPR